MQVLPFAVSVQWGGGFHYFLSYYTTRQEAECVAEAHYLYLEQQRTKKPKAKRGAQPRVFVWSLWESIQSDSTPAVPTGGSSAINPKKEQQR